MFATWSDCAITTFSMLLAYMGRSSEGKVLCKTINGFAPGYQPCHAFLDPKEIVSSIRYV
jgi:hypothetical protein